VTLEKVLPRAITFVLVWLVVAAGLQLTGDALLLLVAGHVTGMSPLAMLLLPLGMLTSPLDPVNAFGADADALRIPLYVLLLLGTLGFVWVTLMRHGYGNPLQAGKSEHELPLSRQLTPRLKDLGVWAKHDAARKDPKASRRDRLQVALLTRFARHKDLARAMTHRLNGMLVPYDGEQPGARVFLGTYRHLHWLRRRKYNVYARPEQHVVIFGPSGAGKGATQMNPTLLFWNGEPNGSPDGHGAGWPGTIITSTVKSDHVDAALEWRLSLSDQCYVYDPLQLYPEYRNFWVGWNPLATIRNFADANSVATALMESESQQSGAAGGNEDYFRAQSLMVMAPMFLSAALSGAAFRDVYDWALRLEAEVADPNVVAADGEVDPNSRTYAVMDKLYEYAEKSGDETPLNQMQQVFSKDPREASGVWGSVRKALQPYNDEKSVMSTDFRHMPRMLDPREFYSTPHATLFIIAPEVANEAKRMRPVFAAFITWMIEEAQKLSREKNGKLPYPVLANLDEVKNVGAIPGLAHTLSLTRSIGFFVKHAWQDEAQIASAYGKDDAKTITSNSRTWVVLPGISDPDHLEALARLIGERPVKKRRAKADPNDPDSSRSMKSASASMVKEVKDDELLIITDNLPPFVIKATRYFQDPVMLARYKLGDARRETGQPPDPQALRRKAAERFDGPQMHKGAAARELVTAEEQWAGGLSAVQPVLPDVALPQWSPSPAPGGLPSMPVGVPTVPPAAKPPALPLPPMPAMPGAPGSFDAPALAPVRESAWPAAPRPAGDAPDWGTGSPFEPNADDEWSSLVAEPAREPLAPALPPFGRPESSQELEGLVFPPGPVATDQVVSGPVVSGPVVSDLRFGSLGGGMFPPGFDSPGTPAPKLLPEDVFSDGGAVVTDSGVADEAGVSGPAGGFGSVLPGSGFREPEPEVPLPPGLESLFAGPAPSVPVVPELGAPESAAEALAGPVSEADGTCPDCGEVIDAAGLDAAQLRAALERHRFVWHMVAPVRGRDADGVEPGPADGWTTP
jgi:type IV secretory pathway TraG/TraD family ATPase VirD4